MTDKNRIIELMNELYEITKNNGDMCVVAYQVSGQAEPAIIGYLGTTAPLIGLCECVKLTIFENREK